MGLHIPPFDFSAELDRPFQILRDISETTGDLKDHYPTDGVCSDRYLRARLRMAG
jgi:hypothetical protein